MNPLLIAIAGPSGSGKTELAKFLARRLDATVFSFDDYYRDLSHLPPSERARTNFDDPAMFDWELLERHAAALARGERISKPVYDFRTHTRAGGEAMIPGGAVILEGLFALHHAGIRRLYGTAVFVDLEDETCLARRMERDIRERGRTRESVIEQYQTTVRPMCERYVRPTRAFADVTVRGDAPLERSAAEVEEHARRGRLA